MILHGFGKLLVLDLLQSLLQLGPLLVVFDKHPQQFGLGEHVRQFGGSECLIHLFTLLKVTIEYNLIFHGPFKTLLLLLERIFQANHKQFYILHFGALFTAIGDKCREVIFDFLQILDDLLEIVLDYLYQLENIFDNIFDRIHLVIK